MLVSRTSHTRTSRGHGSMKAVAALLLVGMLILWAELPTGRRCPGTRHGEEKLRGSSPRRPSLPRSQPVPSAAGSAWSCPPVRFTCALHNPPNQCFVDRHCPRGKKCCLPLLLSPQNFFFWGKGMKQSGFTLAV
uniref:Uncharacterized protein n=1 Tax=Geospiza parvula TaxID=87175 RepID=A0A8C3QAE5_GEOPR